MIRKKAASQLSLSFGSSRASPKAPDFSKRQPALNAGPNGFLQSSANFRSIQAHPAIKAPLRARNFSKNPKRAIALINARHRILLGQARLVDQLRAVRRQLEELDRPAKPRAPRPRQRQFIEGQRIEIVKDLLASGMSSKKIAAAEEHAQGGIARLAEKTALQLATLVYSIPEKALERQAAIRAIRKRINAENPQMPIVEKELAVLSEVRKLQASGEW